MFHPSSFKQASFNPASWRFPSDVQPPSYDMSYSPGAIRTPAARRDVDHIERQNELILSIVVSAVTRGLLE